MTSVNLSYAVGQMAFGIQATGSPDTGTVSAPGWGSTPTEQQAVGAAPATGSAPPGAGSMIIPLVLAMLVIMVMSTMMGGRKEKKKRAELMSSLKKNDRVQTIGGIIGSVAEVRKDEVVLRVDESSNVRIRFAKSAISGIVSEAPGADRAIEDKAAKFQSETVGAPN